MDSSHPSNGVVSQLKDFRSAGLSFEEAKQKLLNQGVTENQINSAVDDFPYDTSEEKPDIPREVTEYYQAHPEQGVAAGEDLLKAKHEEDYIDERNQAMLDIGAAEAGKAFGVQGIDVQTEYESKFAADVGVSFWALIGIQTLLGVGVFVAINVLKLPSWTYLVDGLVGLVLVIYLIRRLKR